jgi:hypothetical protein
MDTKIDRRFLLSGKSGQLHSTEAENVHPTGSTRIRQPAIAKKGLILSIERQP